MSAKRAPRVVLLADADHGDAMPGDAREDRVLLANVGQRRIRKCAEHFRVLHVLRKNLHELVRSRVSRRREQHRMDETEDGGVGADAEGQHEDGRDRKARRLEELPDRETEIVDHLAVRCAESGLWIQTSPLTRAGRPRPLHPKQLFAANPGCYARTRNTRAGAQRQEGGQGVLDAGGRICPRRNGAHSRGETWRGFGQAGDRHRPLESAASRGKFATAKKGKDFRAHEEAGDA